MLVLLVVLGMVHGLFWALATPVWGPIDELAHVAYVDALADGRGIPVVGKDLVPDPLLAIAKASPTSPYRSGPYPPDNTFEFWGGTRHQYEATFAPTYYGAMAPVYAAARPLGLPAQILAVRIATVLVAAASLPLMWATARRFFPRRPGSWLVAPALVVMVNSLAFGSVTNDAPAVALGVATVLAVMRSLDRRTPRAAATAGAVLGIAVLTKPTALMVLPLLVALVLWWWRETRPSGRTVGMLGAVAVVVAVVVVAPWVVWNLATYGTTTGVAEVLKVMGPTERSFTWARLGEDVGALHLGLFASQQLRSLSYDLLWGALVVLLPGVAVARWWRRDRPEAVAVLLCAGTLPAAFAVNQVVNYIGQSGGGAPIGRHLLVALPFALLAAAAGLVAIASARWLVPSLLLLAAASVALEATSTADFVARTYLAWRGPAGDVAEVEQRWSDEAAPLGGQVIRIDVTCAVEAVEVGWHLSPPPGVLQVQGPGGPRTATLVELSSGIPVYDPPRADRALYLVPSPVPGPLSLVLPESTVLNRSLTDREGAVSFESLDADPVVAAYCGRIDDAEAFTRAYEPGHAIAIPLGTLRWPFAAAAALLALAAVGAAVRAMRAPG